MEIFKEIGPLRAFLKVKRSLGKSIGLVPTMGALHEGHLSLIKTSQKENDLTICSIYVNPTQFNNPEDLVNYPQTLDKDVELLRKVQCDILFCPGNDQMYQNDQMIRFNFGHLDTIMEAYYRPGHFSGVALVVAKFFNILSPDRVYFGQKDWHQFVIIRQLKEELKFNLELKTVPTVREEDGLAKSSRNLRLSVDQRSQASVFFKALSHAKKLLKSGAGVAQAKEEVKKIVEQQAGVKLEYFEVADSQNLNILDNVSTSNSPILCIAGFVGNVRLIDNMFLDLP